ncbi:hypothetical protein KCP75_04725 [Salmonella enterica subsp. enterica]|nr:hypothetical protein KCP75_04725 [Salmonella enterica subsp. enterica]
MGKQKLIYRDLRSLPSLDDEGGFARMYPPQACVRSYNPDFITAPLKIASTAQRYRRVPGRAGRSRRSRGLGAICSGH